MKCAENIKPINSTKIYKGLRKPHTGQNDAINANTQKTPSPVAIGIKLGQ